MPTPTSNPVRQWAPSTLPAQHTGNLLDLGRTTPRFVCRTHRLRSVVDEAFFGATSTSTAVTQSSNNESQTIDRDLRDAFASLETPTAAADNGEVMSNEKIMALFHTPIAPTVAHIRPATMQSFHSHVHQHGQAASLTSSDQVHQNCNSCSCLRTRLYSI